MGGAVGDYCAANGIEIAAGVDIKTPEKAGYPVFSDISDFGGDADCIIDFSSPRALGPILEYAGRRDMPAVLAVTGYSAADLEKIGEFAVSHRVFRSPNMSVGVALLTSLVRKAASVGGYDVEIVEKHHRNKLDAPSGTAVMLAEEIRKTAGGEIVKGRAACAEKRPRGVGEIGIASVRGGSIVGDHDVIFAGDGETLTLSHRAESREVFASGAVSAARFIVTRAPGKVYTMDDLIEGSRV